MGSIITEFENFFKKKTVLSNLIAINILVFLLLKIIRSIGVLFVLNLTGLPSFMGLSSDFGILGAHPWTLITYMFTHEGFLHIFFNMLLLYWFGKIFLNFFSERQLGGLYLLGGISGGLLYMLSFKIFPYFALQGIRGNLIGASAAVMAIVFAASFYRKDYEIRILFAGNIKLVYVAVLCLVVDLLSVTSLNGGGHIAHIGGALVGFLFSESIKRNRDITSWINKIIDFFADLFKRNRQRAPKVKFSYRKPESDYEYNKRQYEENKEIDRILEKVKQSGYKSLSEDEKKRLFDASKK